MKPSSLGAREIALAAMFGALTYLGSLLVIPIGPVPITLQTLFVEVAAILLLPKTAGLAMFAHLLLKFITQGGSLLISPSFGFVIGFIFAAFAGSYYFNTLKGGHLSDKKSLLVALFISAILPYLVGLPYMAYILNGVNGLGKSFMDLMKAGFLLFIPGDMAKVVLAYLLSMALLPAVQKSRR